MSDQTATRVAAARRGDREAFSELVKAFLPAVVATALSIVHSRESAEDVAQVAFTRAWQGLKTLRVDEAFATWLMEVTRNCARNWLRDHAFQNSFGRDLPEKPAPETPSGDLPAPVQKLAPELREVIVLRYVSDLSYEEIAATTGQPLSVVKDRLYRAKLALQDFLK
jgi:RNA polymerase sigma-70 factor (ECF subfamily)